MIHHQRKGLTLIECLVILAIIVIIIGLLIPANRKVREAGSVTHCQNNLKQLNLALYNYESFHGHFPKGCFSTDSTLPIERRLSWYVAILPFIEKNQLSKQFDSKDKFTGLTEKENQEILAFKCPFLGKEKTNLTSYLAVAGVGYDAAERPAASPGNGIMGYDRITKLIDVKDGLSNTICLVETNKPRGWPQAGESTLRGFDSNRTIDMAKGDPIGGLHFTDNWFFKNTYMQTNIAMCDGSVRRLSEGKIDKKLFSKLITIADNDNDKENFDW
jgi:Tfp pilus assembly protein PilE